MLTIHNTTTAGGVAVSLVARSSDHMIVIDTGPIAYLDPRGRNRDHAVRCYLRTVEDYAIEIVNLRTMLDMRAQADVPPDAA